jgi:hypothetical protein
MGFGDLGNNEGLTMTRKDYILLAAAMNKRLSRALSLAPDENLKAFQQWDADVNYLMDALVTDNYRFDKVKFINACNKREQHA